jgi:hypothetical protein
MMIGGVEGAGQWFQPVLGADQGVPGGRASAQWHEGRRPPFGRALECGWKITCCVCIGGRRPVEGRFCRGRLG